LYDSSKVLRMNFVPFVIRMVNFYSAG